MFSVLLNGSSGETSRHGAGRVFARVPVAMVVAVGLIALAGCGSSKPPYCTDRTNFENSIKGLTSAVSSRDVSQLKTQATKIQSDATSLVNAAKSDFPTETSAIKSSVDTLQSAVKALKANPSASQIATIATDAATAASSVSTFVDASQSKCS